MTSSMASLLMSGERRAFSGSDISGGSNKNASARRGEDDISGISGAAKVRVNAIRYTIQCPVHGPYLRVDINVCAGTCR